MNKTALVRLAFAKRRNVQTKQRKAMKKMLTPLLLCVAAPLSWAQGANELLGKWQLVGMKNAQGQAQSIEETFGTRQVFQVFSSPNVFDGVIGERSLRGKWALSDDGKLLTIKLGGQSYKFPIERFSPQKRVIRSPDQETLSYEKR